MTGVEPARGLFVEGHGDLVPFATRQVTHDLSSARGLQDGPKVRPQAPPRRSRSRELQAGLARGNVGIELGNLGEALAGHLVRCGRVAFVFDDLEILAKLLDLFDWAWAWLS
jgi:hypothetical protein